MNVRRSNRKAGGWLRHADWIGFGAGIAAAAVVWAALHGGRGEAPAVRQGTEARASSEAAAHQLPGQKQQSAQAAVGHAGGAEAGGASSAPKADSPKAADKLVVRVYLTGERKIETVPLEAYVRGVVAAEMPLDFEPAALEAQALAARTYIVRRLLNGDRTGVPAAGEGAVVTDTTTHQVYRPQAEMAALQKADPKAWAKADEAAKRTQGKILAYSGEPIEALFFSSSNGYTENSEDVFPDKLPYLRSVASPWDREAVADWMDTREMTLQEFYKKLGVSGTVLAGKSAAKSVRVAERTAGQRVKTLQVGSQAISGTDARDKLGLKSAAFDVTATGRNVVITTYGSGHGVGMSQWGAEAMAKRGRTAEQIVEYYYTGVGIEEVSKLADRLDL